MYQFLPEVYSLEKNFPFVLDNFDNKAIVLFITKDSVATSLFEFLLYKKYPMAKEKIFNLFFDGKFDYGQIYPFFKNEIKIFFVPAMDTRKDNYDQDCIDFGIEKLNEVLLIEKYEFIKNIMFFSNNNKIIEEFVTNSIKNNGFKFKYTFV